MYKTRAWKPTVTPEDRLFIIDSFQLIDSNFETIEFCDFHNFADMVIEDNRHNIRIMLEYGHYDIQNYRISKIDQRINALKHNQERYDYKLIGAFGYRIPKSAAICWNHCLAAPHKCALIVAYKAISAAVLPEVSDIILRATLHCIMWDLDNYVDKSAA